MTNDETNQNDEARMIFVEETVHVFSAKGAPSWQPGATPQGNVSQETALKARFKPRRLVDSRFQRLGTGELGRPGAVPQAKIENRADGAKQTRSRWFPGELSASSTVLAHVIRH